MSEINDMYKSMRKNTQDELILYAKGEIQSAGYEITVETETYIEFEYKGHPIRFYPYRGWATGKTIKDGRGIKNLIKQITE